MSEFNSITGEDLNYILSKLNNTNYMFDPVLLSVLKPCSSIINPVLRLIVTRSFAESSFPNQLKHATTTPIIKNTNLDPDNFKNYRPINNTPYLVLQKAAFYQINDHLINNGLYCPRHYRTGLMIRFFKKMTYSSGENDTEIDFVPVGKEKRKNLRDMKLIPGELQHRLVVVDVEEQKLKKSVKKSKRVKWRVWN